MQDRNVFSRQSAAGGLFQFKSCPQIDFHDLQQGGEKSKRWQLAKCSSTQVFASRPSQASPGAAQCILAVQVVHDGEVEPQVLLHVPGVVLQRQQVAVQLPVPARRVLLSSKENPSARQYEDDLKDEKANNGGQGAALKERWVSPGVLACGAWRIT